MAILAMLASLFGCGKHDPYILDGPGMVYVDSEYRNEYANCLPFDDIQGAPYFAVAYLGKGDAGEKNKDNFITTVFGSLGEEKINRITTHKFEGDDWYIVVPRYYSRIDLKKGDESIRATTYDGEAFVVRCNSDITVNVFEVTDMYYTLCIDENGNLKNTDENVWDITQIENIMNLKNGE